MSSTREEANRRNKIAVGNSRLDKVYDSAVAAGQKLIGELKDTEPLGFGFDKAVYDRKDGKVVAFFKPSPETGYVDKLKVLYFKQKLGHILVPDVFPDAYMVGVEPPMMLLEKVEGTPVSHEEARDLEADLRKELGIGIDNSPGNFIKDKDGRVRYIDLFIIWNYTKLQEAMRSLGDQEFEDAHRYLQRVAEYPEHDTLYVATEAEPRPHDLVM